MTRTSVIIVWLCFAVRINKLRVLDKRVRIWNSLGTSSKTKTWSPTRLFRTVTCLMNTQPTSSGLWVPASTIVYQISNRILKSSKAWTRKQDLWSKIYLPTSTGSQTLLVMASITLTLKLAPSNESLMLQPVKCETTSRSFLTMNKTSNRWVPNQMAFVAVPNSSSSQAPDSKK